MTAHPRPKAGWALEKAPGQKSTHPASVLTVLPDGPSQDMPGMAMP